jgi:hypothetical protein
MPNAESKRRAPTPRVNTELGRRCQMPMCRHAEHSFGSATLRNYVDLGASPNNYAEYLALCKSKNVNAKAHPPTELGKKKSVSFFLPQVFIQVDTF